MKVLAFDEMRGCNTVLRYCTLCRSLGGLNRGMGVVRCGRPFLRTSDEPFVFGTFVGGLARPHSFLECVGRCGSEIVDRGRCGAFGSLCLSYAGPYSDGRVPPGFSLCVVKDSRI